MKVFNLRCTHGHGFEGWFGSDQELVSQRERGLLTCPVCGDAQVQKLPSAPRLNLRSATVGGTAMASDQSGLPAAAMAVTGAPEQLAQIRLLEAMRLLVSRSEDVGERFPEQALAMHHGEMEPRAIRGQATAEQALELLDEGVALLPLPALKENPALVPSKACAGASWNTQTTIREDGPPCVRSRLAVTRLIHA